MWNPFSGITKATALATQQAQPEQHLKCLTLAGHH
jgi:hypothetical protein